jgi:hypothetical protein
MCIKIYRCVFMVFSTLCLCLILPLVVAPHNIVYQFLQILHSIEPENTVDQIFGSTGSPLGICSHPAMIYMRADITLLCDGLTTNRKMHIQRIEKWRLWFIIRKSQIIFIPTHQGGRSRQYADILFHPTQNIISCCCHTRTKGL